MADQSPTTEGTIPLTINAELRNITKPCFTYYKIFGDLSCGAPAVVILHGGPGVGHEYLLPFAQLWPQYGLPVVFYDQIGCGASTHLPETAGDANLWHEALFTAELNNLLDALQLREGAGFHIFGHSWGGNIAAAFAAARPHGLQKLILASGLASNELSRRGIEIRRGELGPDTLATFERYEKDKDYGNLAYQAACAAFNKSFVCRTDPLPEVLMPAFKHLQEDNTVYNTIIGPSIHVFIGSMVDWTSIPRLHQITAPTLVYNGEYDTSHDIAQVPFFELIPLVRWITFAKGSHMCHVEDGVKDKVLEVVGQFLIQT